uniref:Uncharacterized protein n=1 Tax=Anguilla anguilla TaxID=7936 RepID=A0A0E9RZI7_ANGAN
MAITVTCSLYIAGEQDRTNLTWQFCRQNRELKHSPQSTVQILLWQFPRPH